MCTSTGSVSPRTFLVEVGNKDPFVASRGAQAGVAAPDRELRGAATSAWMCYTWLLLQSTSPVPSTPEVPYSAVGEFFGQPKEAITAFDIDGNGNA